MIREQWARLPFRLAPALVLAGALVLLITWYGSGEQVFPTTQLPYVLVGGGVGCGLVGFGASVYAAQRRRLDVRRLEDAVASIVVASDRLAAARLAGRPTRRRPAYGASKKGSPGRA